MQVVFRLNEIEKSYPINQNDKIEEVRSLATSFLTDDFFLLFKNVLINSAYDTFQIADLNFEGNVITFDCLLKREVEESDIAMDLITIKNDIDRLNGDSEAEENKYKSVEKKPNNGKELHSSKGQVSNSEKEIFVNTHIVLETDKEAEQEAIEIERKQLENEIRKAEAEIVNLNSEIRKREETLSERKKLLEKEVSSFGKKKNKSKSKGFDSKFLTLNYLKSSMNAVIYQVCPDNVYHKMTVGSTIKNSFSEQLMYSTKYDKKLDSQIQLNHLGKVFVMNERDLLLFNTSNEELVFVKSSKFIYAGGALVYVPFIKSLMAFGGADGQSETMDKNLSGWNLCCPMKSARIDFGSYVVNDKIVYAFCGWYKDKFENFKYCHTIERIDFGLSKLDWNEMDLKTSKWSFGVGVVGFDENKVLIVGGKYLMNSVIHTNYYVQLLDLKKGRIDELGIKYEPDTSEEYKDHNRFNYEMESNFLRMIDYSDIEEKVYFCNYDKSSVYFLLDFEELKESLEEFD